MRSFVPDYELIAADSLRDAVELVSGGWRPVAGGTDVMVLFNAGKLPYRRLVSIRRTEELIGIETSATEISIGAAVTYSRIRQHEILQSEFPLLCTAASWTGAIANQNRGTLGGNIVNGSPAADSAPALLVYDAELELVSPAGVRRIPYGQFHHGYKKMDLRDGELVRAIHLRRRTVERRQYIRKVGPRKAQAISKVALAATAEMDGRVVWDVRIAVASVGPVPLRCYRTEDLLRGESLSPSLVEHTAQKIAEEITPIDDIRSTESYRRLVTANLLSEFLQSLR